VLAGSFTKPVPAKAGDVFDVDYGVHGRLQFKFVDR
jgi:2-oxo-hept-3-ene-1,7-dioate hydratase